MKIRKWLSRFTLVLLLIPLNSGCKSKVTSSPGFSGALRFRAVDGVTGANVASHLNVGFVHPAGSYADIDGSTGLLVHNTTQASEGAAMILTYEYEPYNIPRSMFQVFDGFQVDHGELQEVTIKLIPKRSKVAGEGDDQETSKKPAQQAVDGNPH